MTGKRTKKNKPGAGPPKLHPLQKRIARNFTLSPKIFNIMYFLARQYRLKNKKRLMLTSLVEIGILLLASLEESEMMRILNEHTKNRLLRDKKIDDLAAVKKNIENK